MRIRRVGQFTVVLENLPRIIATGTAVGPKEGRGPLGKTFDYVASDIMLGQKSFEKAELELMKEACNTLLAQHLYKILEFKSTLIPPDSSSSHGKVKIENDKEEHT
jgi:hypothetical protein